MEVADREIERKRVAWGARFMRSGADAKKGRVTGHDEWVNTEAIGNDADRARAACAATPTTHSHGPAPAGPYSESAPARSPLAIMDYSISA